MNHPGDSTTSLSNEMAGDISLFENPAILRGFLDQFPGHLLVLGPYPDMVIVFGNDLVFKTWGRDKGVIGKRLLDVLPELIGQPFPSILKQVYETGTAYVGKEELVVLMRNGVREEVYYDYVYSPIFTEGQVAGVTVSAYDITPQVHARKRAEQREHAWESLANAMPQLVWMADGAGVVYFYNERVVEFSGAERTASGEWKWEGLCHPDDEAATTAAWTSAVARGDLYEVEHRIRMQDGSFRWHLSRALPIKDSNGVIVKWYGTATDIDKQKHAEEKLRFSQKRYETLAQASSSIIWTTDPSGRFVDEQLSWHKFTGQSPDEYLGDGWLQMIHPEDKGMIGDVWLEACRTIGVYDVVCRIWNDVHKEYRYVRARAIPVCDDDGNIVEWVGMDTDIHDQWQAGKLLMESEERYSTTVNASELGIWDLDVKKQEVVAGGKMHVIYGLPDNESVDLVQLEKCVHPEDRRRRNDLMKAVAAGEVDQHFSIEYRIVQPKSLDVRWVRVNGKAIPDADGLVYRVVGTVADITEQKKAELALLDMSQRLENLVAERTAKLQSSLELLRHAERTARMGNWQWNVRRNEQRWSDNLYRLFGYEPGEVEPSLDNFTKKVHPDDLGIVLKSSQQALQEGIASDNIFRIVTVAGEVRYVRGVGTAIDLQGELHVIGTTQDVTELVTALEKIKHQNLQLAETQSFLQTVLNSSMELVTAFDTDLRYTYLNQKAEQYFGRKPEDILGKRITEIYPGVENTPLYGQLQKVLQGEVVHIDRRNSLFSDEVIFENYLMPLKTNNLVTGVVSLKRDVTDIIHLTESLRESNANLMRSNEELQRFAHITSHDLKEPVRKIMVYSTRLRAEYEGTLPERAMSYCEKIESSSDRLFKMIDGILKYSELQTEQKFNSLINLNEIINSVKSDLEVVIQEKGAHIECEELPEIKGSAVLLNQVFYNLINNALKFTKPQTVPRIHVRARQDKLKDSPAVVISVSDNGIGFNEEYSEAIFKTFTRLHSKDQYEGSGLGLALCKSIIEKHNGTIAARGRVNAGAEFQITLPL